MIEIFAKTSEEHGWRASVSGSLGIVCGLIALFTGSIFTAGLSLGFGIVTIFHAVQSFRKAN